MSIMNPAGGLLYHFSARRFQKTLWSDFIQDLSRGLETWQPASKKLLLVGPSAGYCLTDKFLERFERIDAIDPDRLAPLFFKRSHPKIKIHWDRGDYFKPERNRFRIRTVDPMLDKYSDHAILFSNFLGQLPALYKASPISFQVFKVDLTKRLKNREWASFHDRFSGSPVPDVPPELDKFINEMNMNEIVETFYHLDADGAAELLDHETEGLFKGCQRKYFLWPLKPGQFHLIELTHHQVKCRPQLELVPQNLFE